MSWRVRVVHTTGYVYEAPVVQSYNEARLTPRGDRRQNVVVSRVETSPATRAYRYTDYWGTAPKIDDLVFAITSAACTITAIGLVLHLSLMLRKFLESRTKRLPAPAMHWC